MTDLVSRQFPQQGARRRPNLEGSCCLAAGRIKLRQGPISLEELVGIHGHLIQQPGLP